MSTLTLWLEHIGVLAVFALVLVEQIGLPLPTYPLLIVAGAWSAQGGASFARIAAAAVTACLLADLTWYAAGRRFGSRVLRAMCRLSLEPDSCVSTPSTCSHASEHGCLCWQSSFLASARWRRQFRRGERAVARLCSLRRDRRDDLGDNGSRYRGNVSRCHR